MSSRLKKAAWIAQELDEDVDDVYDALLGNIKDFELSSAVNALSLEYDNVYEKAVYK